MPTADPTAVAPIGDGYGQFLGDGGSVVLSGTDGASVVDLASEESRVLTDTMTGAVPVGDLVLLQTSETEAALVDPTSGDTLQTLTLGADASSPVRAEDAVLLSTDANQDWQLIDGTDGTVTPVPDLAGYREQPSPTGEGRWVVFRSTDQGRPVVGVDTGDGGVQPIAALPDGERFTSIAAMAPDGPWMVAATDSNGPAGTAVHAGAADQPRHRRHRRPRPPVPGRRLLPRRPAGRVVQRRRRRAPGRPGRGPRAPPHWSPPASSYRSGSPPDALVVGLEQPMATTAAGSTRRARRCPSADLATLSGRIRPAGLVLPFWHRNSSS